MNEAVGVYAGQGQPEINKALQEAYAHSAPIPTVQNVSVRQRLENNIVQLQTAIDKFQAKLRDLPPSILDMPLSEFNSLRSLL